VEFDVSEIAQELSEIPTVTMVRELLSRPGGEVELQKIIKEESSNKGNGEKEIDSENIKSQ